MVSTSSAKWNYDPRGNVITETRTVTNTGTFATRWVYNSANQVKSPSSTRDFTAFSIRYPNGNSGATGEQVNYNYHPQMLLNSVAGTEIPRCALDYAYVQSTKYDTAGRITLRQLTNHLRTTYDYYSWGTQGGRLQYLKTITNTVNLLSLQYLYDSVGNITTIYDYVTGNPQTQTEGVLFFALF